MNVTKRYPLDSYYWILIIFTILSLMGCMSGYAGKTVPLQNRIVIKDDGPHRGSWTRRHATFNYMYTLTSRRLELTGDLSIGRLRGRLVSFHLWLYLIDENGIITEHLIIFSSNSNRQGVIKKDLILPAQISAIAFGYTGESKDRINDNKQTDSFHSSPLYLK